MTQRQPHFLRMSHPRRKISRLPTFLRIRGDFFSSLLSYSPSRVLIKRRHSGSAQALWFRTTSTAGGRAERRRLSKLSCAGWLPHDRGFVLELPL